MLVRRPTKYRDHWRCDIQIQTHPMTWSSCGVATQASCTKSEKQTSVIEATVKSCTSGSGEKRISQTGDVEEGATESRDPAPLSSKTQITDRSSTQPIE